MASIAIELKDRTQGYNFTRHITFIVAIALPARTKHSQANKASIQHSKSIISQFEPNLLDKTLHIIEKIDSLIFNLRIIEFKKLHDPFRWIINN